MPEEKMVRRSTGEQAAHYIRRLIFDGQLRPGSRVPQDEIARTLGISRIPVREALLSLEHEGWVTIRPHRGAFIGSLDEAVVRDLYVLYGILYGFAARRTAVHRSPEALTRMERLCADLAGEDDAAQVNRLSGELNRMVLETGNSARLRAMVLGMVGIVPGNFFMLVPGAVAVEREHAPRFVGAVRSRLPEDAAAAYARKFDRLGDLVVDLLAERGLFNHA